ncbi:MAG: hypothetical protein HRU06_04600 [Oceanospirillaceae bacterium]|nr:hypothetical protein [Oceanospirillaceae bacterium]
MKMDYFKNIELALSLGFEEVIDENAYRGKCYIKNNIIWIHNIEALKEKLSVCNDRELRSLNYDVDSYYKYIEFSNDMVDHQIEKIKASIMSSDSVLSGRHELLAEPSLLQTMGSLAEEGFDEEILADYAHQMSKR